MIDQVVARIAGGSDASSLATNGAREKPILETISVTTPVTLYAGCTGTD